MDAIEAITTRRSVRAFKPDPVPRAILDKVLESARYAPSWGNTQSWELHVLGGEPLGRVRRALEAKERAGEAPGPDLPWPEFRGEYAERRKELALGMLERMAGSERGGAARRRLGLRNIRFFDAPHAVIGTVDEATAPYTLVDLGIAFQTLALAAHCHGLGTCIQVKVITYPEVLREILGVAENRLIALGLALGYPDRDAPINYLERSRLPATAFVTWHDGG